MPFLRSGAIYKENQFSLVYIHMVAKNKANFKNQKRRSFLIFLRKQSLQYRDR